jgi:hypothetical protein
MHWSRSLVPGHYDSALAPLNIPGPSVTIIKTSLSSLQNQTLNLWLLYS